MARYVSILIYFTFAVCAFAADTATGIFDRRFHTLKAEVEDNFLAPPAIRLGTDDRILIKFDEIGEDNSWLEYRLIHCNADWQPSRLIESEYVEGFNSQKIEDFAFSTATFVHYVNYLIALPNEDLQILHSGNYLLQVYDPEEPDETLLQIRFQVSENNARIEGKATSRTDRGHNTIWQQTAFTVDCSGIGRVNPYQDILVQVTQNNRASTLRDIHHPLRVDGNSVVYDHLAESVWPASNEYRRFESTSNAFAGMHVDSLRYMGSNYHVWLKPDEPRAERQYSFDRTQHGRFIVREYNATNSDIAADYITVHFSLDMDELYDRDIYIDGEFTHDSFGAENKMTYNRSNNRYEVEIPLKQGAYNYQYVVVPRTGNGTSDPAPIEGNHYETENEYLVNVWYRPAGARADRLVGLDTIISN